MPPLVPIEELQLDEHGTNAWDLLLQAERAALAAPPSSDKYNDNVIGIRVLGFFLKDFWDHQADHGFGLTPYETMHREIFSCRRDPASNEDTHWGRLYKLGLNYRNHLLRVFCSDAEPLPTPSNHVSRPSFDVVKGRIIDAMAIAPKTKTDVKEQALLRDGYRCTLTGLYDFTSCDNHQEVDEKREAEGIGAIDTECAHLFSESAQDSGKPRDYAATAFAMLEMFGLGREVTQLLGGQVNNLHNVITMSSHLHKLFDNFSFWLEPVHGQPNTYKVCTHGMSKLFILAARPRECITFEIDPAVKKACEDKGLLEPFPDRDLIAIRAACARVAHMSGAAEQAKEILRDIEEITVMADDGSTAELLRSRLSMAQMDVQG